MAEVYLWAAAGGFCLFGYGMARRLGLLDEVPRDPKARVASFASEALLLVKEQLIGAQILECAPDRVVYIQRGAKSLLWNEPGLLQCEEGKVRRSVPLGDQGKLEFSWQNEEILVTILTAESEGAEHQAQVALPVAAGSLP